MIVEPFGRPTILVVVGAYVVVIMGSLGWAIVEDLRATRRRGHRP
jgi:hypothetical protein